MADKNLAKEVVFMQSSRQSGFLCDCVIRNGHSGTEFLVHKVMMAAASVYWEETLEASPSRSTFDLPDGEVGDAEISRALDWIYYGVITVEDWKSLVDTLTAASALRVSGLQQECRALLVEGLDLSNVCSLWFHSDKIGDDSLSSTCCKYAAVHFPSLSRRFHSVLMGLPVQYMHRLLRHDHLAVSSEVEVCTAISGWFSAARHRRALQLPLLLSALRLGPLSEKRRRVPPNVAVVLEATSTRPFSVLTRWYDSRRDEWHATEAVPEPLLKASSMYPAMSAVRRAEVVFVQNTSMITMRTAQEVLSFNLVTSQCKELSTLCDVSEHQRLLCVRDSIRMLTYFPLKAFQVYDAEDNRWTYEPVEDDLLPLTVGCTAATLGGDVFLVGGQVLDAGGVYSKVISRYSRCENRFKLAAEMAIGRARPTCCAWNGKLVIAGGYSNADLLKTVEVFDVLTGKVTPMPPMLKERVDFHMLVCDDGLLVIDDWITGQDNIEYFNPQANCWETRHSLGFRTNSVLGIGTFRYEDVLKTSNLEMGPEQNIYLK